MDKKLNIPPKKPEATRLFTEGQGKYLLNLTDEIVKAWKKGYVLHSLILSSSIIEEVLIPHLTDMVFIRLGISNKKMLLNQENFYIKNLLYFALTQDSKLFEKLEKYRKIRNKVTHKIIKYQNIDKIKEEADKGLKCFRDIVKEVRSRLKGETPIPVLSYYPKGWNDAINKVLERIKKM